MTVIVKSLCHHFRAFISADQMAEFDKELGTIMFDQMTSMVGSSGGICTDLCYEVGSENS